MDVMDEIEVKPVEELPPIDNINPSSFVVEANTYAEISYDDFFNKHMRNNVPCIIKNIGQSWEASQKWAFNNVIDFDYLSNQYGTLNVRVSDCKISPLNCHPKSDMKFSDYITYWKGNTKEKILYLKDWHLRRCKPNDRFYTVPTLFGSDWLNEYAQDKQVDDFMFVYMGPTASWTPVHADVYESYSWSVNVSGRKKWYLFPPGQEDKLIDKYNTVVIRFEPESYKDKSVTYFEITQEKGDAIFIPSGWYHQVENEMDTISINHNWINGTNLMKVWAAMMRNLAAVEKEIDQFKNQKDFPSLCQNMLKILFGMDCEGFQKLIIHIAHKRIAQLDGGSNLAFSNIPLGKNHCIYDLNSIYEVMQVMKSHITYIDELYHITEEFHVLNNMFGIMFH